MKTLHEIAAKDNLFTFDRIPQEWRNDRFEHGTREEKDGIPEFLQGLEGWQSGRYYECRTQDAGTDKEFNYIDHSYILVLRDGADIPLLLRQDWRTKKYWFHLPYQLANKYQGISYHQRNKVAESLTEPNHIGVFTVKKLLAWDKYVVDYFNAFEDLYNQTNDKNKELEQQIADFIGQLDGCKVSTYSNRTNVYTDLFEVNFEHHKDQAYLRADIKFKGGFSDVILINQLLTSKSK